MTSAGRRFGVTALVFVLVSCGGGQSPAPSGLGSAADDQASPALPSPVPSIDASARLVEALDAMADAYSLDSTVTVGQEVATHAVGTWVSGASEVEVESGAATVTYRSLPPKAWIREGEDGDWVELAGEVPIGDPLDELRSPASVSVVTTDGSALELLATYPASALGLKGDGPVDVNLRLVADGSVVARYEALMSAGPAVAQTTIQPLADASPIPAPSLGS